MSRLSNPQPRTTNVPAPDTDPTKGHVERTRLHTHDVVHWLRKRFLHTNPNMNYLFFPEELRKQREVEKIFIKFDEDGSGKLGFGEFHKILYEANIKVSADELREFFYGVDDNHDHALDFSEFKNCTLSEDANQRFGLMMKQFRESEGLDRPNITEEDGKPGLFRQLVTEDDGEGKDDKKKRFLPRTFGNLLNYITYENKKKELNKFLSDESLKFGDRFEKFKDLVDLKIGKDLYFAKYNEKFKTLLPRWTNRKKTGNTVTYRNTMVNFQRTGGSALKFMSKLDKEIKQESETLIKELNTLSKQAKEEAKSEFEENKQKQRKRLQLITTSNAKPHARKTSHNETLSTSKPKKEFDLYSASHSVDQPVQTCPSNRFKSSWFTTSMPTSPERVEIPRKKSQPNHTADPGPLISPKGILKRKNLKLITQSGLESAHALTSKLTVLTKSPQAQASPVSILEKLKVSPRILPDLKTTETKESDYRPEGSRVNESVNPFYEIHMEDNHITPKHLETSHSMGEERDWDQIIEKRKVDMSCGLHEVKPSNMPVGYSNVFPTLQHQKSVSTAESGKFGKRASIGDAMFTSPRTATGTGSRLKIKSIDNKSMSTETKGLTAATTMVSGFSGGGNSCNQSAKIDVPSEIWEIGRKNFRPKALTVIGEPVFITAPVRSVRVSVQKMETEGEQQPEKVELSLKEALSARLSGL